ncbi:MAG: hypothetical protein IAE88_00595 [Rhodobacteraceae bacterium]|nr:hypothetical protein [Paracoccaceae bacterium]
MKDTQLRGIILGKYYEHRRSRFLTLKPEDFDPPIAIEDILAISDQLGQHGLIEWKALESYDGIEAGLGKITAFGIDVVEGEATPDIKVEFVQNKAITVTGSSNVVVGDHNQMSITQHVAELARVIDNSNGTPQQKAEAKGLLLRLVEHPLVASIAGGAIGLLRD